MYQRHNFRALNDVTRAGKINFGFIMRRPILDGMMEFRVNAEFRGLFKKIKLFY